MYYRDTSISYPRALDVLRVTDRLHYEERFMPKQPADLTMTADLDRIDLAIIAALRRDGRVTYQRLSELVNLTPRPCLERVRKLEKRGVIRGYRAIIDMQKLESKLVMSVQIALSSQNRTAQTAFEAELARSNSVLDAYLLGGSYDYMVRLSCDDMLHYREITEVWLTSPQFQIERINGHPELATLKTVVSV